MKAPVTIPSPTTRGNQSDCAGRPQSPGRPINTDRIREIPGCQPMHCLVRVQQDLILIKMKLLILLCHVMMVMSNM